MSRLFTSLLVDKVDKYSLEDKQDYRFCYFDVVYRASKVTILWSMTKDDSEHMVSLRHSDLLLLYSSKIIFFLGGGRGRFCSCLLIVEKTT